MGQLCSGTAPVGFSSARTALSCAASLPWGGCTAFGYLQAYKANNAMKLRQQSSPPFSSSEPSRGNAPTLKKKKEEERKSNIAIESTEGDFRKGALQPQTQLS